MAGAFLYGVPEKPLHETVRLKLPRRVQDFGDTSVMGHLPRKAAKRSGTSPRERSTVQSIKLKGAGHLERVLTSDMKIQCLEFAQLVFSLALVQHSISSLFSLPYILECCWRPNSGKIGLQQLLP